MRSRASELIKTIRSNYTGSRTALEFTICQYLPGNSNAALRQEIILQLTGDKKPLTQCGIHATADAMKAYFDQLSIFA